jgi:CubicO group peptidase (beta-lactamase class C family)
MRPTSAPVLALALALAAAPATALAQADSLPTIINRFLTEAKVPGAQVAVVQRGRIVHLSAHGTANLPFKIPVTETTAFSIASATKSFAGVALMQLVEAGKVRLDDRIDRYVDSLPAAWRAVTLRQLITHISGLPDVLNPQSGILIASSPQAAWARVRTLPVVAPPGTRWSYNHTNYWLLGLMMARVTGEPLHRAIQRQFTAADMPSATIGDVRDVAANTSDTYSYLRFEGDSARRDTVLERVVVDFPRPLRLAAGVNTSARDLARWLIALRDRKLLKNSASLDTLWAPPRMADGTVLGVGGVSSYALGWPTFNDPKHPAVGGIGGARAAFLVYPKDDLSVIVLTNLQGAAPERLARRVAALYLRP